MCVYMYAFMLIIISIILASFKKKNLILIAMPFQNVQVVFRKVSMGLLKSSKLEYWKDKLIS